MNNTKEIVLIIGIHRHIVQAITKKLSSQYEVINVPHHNARSSHLENKLSLIQEESGSHLLSVVYLQFEGVRSFMRRVEKFFHVEQLITICPYEENEHFKVVNLRIPDVYDDEGHASFLEEQFSRSYQHRFISNFFPLSLFHFHSHLHLSDLCEAISKLIERRNHLPRILTLYLEENELLTLAEIQDYLGHLLYQYEWPHHLPRLVERILFRMDLDRRKAGLGEVKELLDWEPEHRLKLVLPKIVDSMKEHPEKLGPEYKALRGWRFFSRFHNIM